ncbi:hypothetical protein ACFLST_00795 [Chloroflexota bacterium]
MSGVKWHWQEIVHNGPTESVPFKPVSDGLVTSRTLADGRPIPILLIDCSSRPDIEDLISSHDYIASDDVKIQWGRSSKNTDVVVLVLSFERPSNCTAVIEFDIVKHGGTVDQIMRCEAVFLQSAKEGERVVSTLDKPKMVVEVPSKQTLAQWNAVLFKVLESDGIKKGMSKKQAKEHSRGVIREWRKFGEQRFNRQP